MRRTSTDVIVSGGINTTMSPNGRKSTPRSVAAAHTRRPHRKPSCGGASSTPPINPLQAHLADRGLRRDAVVQESSELLGTLADVGQHVPGFEQLEVPAGDRSGEGVPAVGVAVVQGAGAEVVAEEGVEHAPAGHGGRHREVAHGQTLAETQEIGPQLALLGCEQGASATEAGRDLVADEQHVVRTARGSEAREAGRVGELHAGRALYEWFDDDGRELVRRVRRRCDRVGEALGVGEVGSAHHREPQRVEDLGPEPPVAE